MPNHIKHAPDCASEDREKPCSCDFWERALPCGFCRDENGGKADPECADCDAENGEPVAKVDHIICPLCGALAPHEVIKGADGRETHAWICSETCPFVGVEANGPTDLNLVGLRLTGVREYACAEPECEAVSQTRSPAPPAGVGEYCDDHLDERKGA